MLHRALDIWVGGHCVRQPHQGLSPQALPAAAARVLILSHFRVMQLLLRLLPLPIQVLPRFCKTRLIDSFDVYLTKFATAPSQAQLQESINTAPRTPCRASVISVRFRRHHLQKSENRKLSNLHTLQLMVQKILPAKRPSLKRIPTPYASS